jgi:hypothetical protein
MARYILIDNNSGYIFGDSADLNGSIFSGSPVEFAAALDASIGEHGRVYEELSRNPRDTSTGYDVYRADVDGSDAVPVVWDGQDQETINAVTQSCRYEGYIRCLAQQAAA